MNKIILILLIAFLSNSELIKQNEVYILNDDNFIEAWDSYEFIFLEFYAPWCTHW